MTTPAPPAGSRPRVLFVEDEPSLQSAYQRFFTRQYEMAFAGTGREARAEFARFRPDVLVLDLHLPDADGVDILRDLREHRPDLPVIFTTAYSSMQSVLEMLGVTHSGYAVKPFELTDLAKLIADAC